jgi:hypothetical protein
LLKPKVYVASALSNKVNATALVNYLEAGGMECTYRWMDVGEVSQAEYPAIAYKEYRGVERASIFIMLYPAKMGSATELGAALADRSKRIYICGTPEYLDKDTETGYYPSIFIYHPHVHKHLRTEDWQVIGNEVLHEAGL